MEIAQSLAKYADCTENESFGLSDSAARVVAVRDSGGFFSLLARAPGGFFFDDHPNIVLNPGVKLAQPFLGVAPPGMVKWNFRPVRQAGQPTEFCAESLFQRLQPLCLQADQSGDSLPERRADLSAWLPVAGFAASTAEFEQRQSLRCPGCRSLDVSPDSTDFGALCRAAHDQSVSFFSVDCADSSHHGARRTDGNWVTISWLILAWGVFWPLSILSKETGVLLPGFVAAYELIIRRSEQGKLDACGERGSDPRRSAASWASFPIWSRHSGNGFFPVTKFVRFPWLSAC